MSNVDEPAFRSWGLNLPREDDPVSERALELRRLAQATRRVIDELMATNASLTTITDVANLVENVADKLAEQPHGRDDQHVGESSLSGDPRGFLEFSPLVGRANPLAPPLVLRLVDGRIVGEAVFGLAYEGPPGHVHGGYIAAAFDEVLGMVQSTTERPGMTGMLTVRYRSPTPLHRPVRFSGEVINVEGRKIFTRATLHDDETLCAEAEGLFISIDFARFEALRSR